MASFLSTGFSTNSFSVLSFDFGVIEEQDSVKGGGKRKRKSVIKEKGYFLEDYKYEAEAALSYEVVTVEIDGLEVTHEVPVKPTINDITISLTQKDNDEKIKDAFFKEKSDILSIILTKKMEILTSLQKKYELEKRYLEEELFIFLALIEDN